jgi:hypothetical protein
MANEHELESAIQAPPPAGPAPALPEAAPPADAAAPPTPEAAPAARPAIDWAQVVNQTDLLLVALLLGLTFLLGSFVATNSDIWLHLATGKQLADGQFQFGVDPYSIATEATATRPAVPWIHQSWLYSLLFYELHENVMSPEALVALKALLLVALFTLLLQMRQPETSVWVLAVCLGLTALVVSTRAFLQPLVLSYLFLALIVYILFEAGALRLPGTEGTSRVKLLWLLPPLCALWANLDEWFVLGPLAIGVCALAAGVQSLRKQPRPVPGRMLAAVFGASLLACLLNPFGLRVFQLPPELAYIVVSVTGNLLPDSLVGAGRTLQVLQQADPRHTSTLSPLSPFYYQPGFGLSWAGLAFYPLLLLSGTSFLLSALAGSRAGTTMVQPLRLALWLVFGLLALINWRLLPFFALVAGPVTALNLGEFLRWQFAQPGVAAPRLAVTAVGRGLLALFFVAMLFLAWPGWLHSPTSDPLPMHRVGWGIRDEPSMRHAAERLAQLKADKKVSAVFNISPEFTHYCAWYAPGVKCYLDRRYALFTDAASTHLKISQAMLDPKQPDKDWPKDLRDLGIDHVEWMTTRTDYGFIWAHAPTWDIDYGDGRTFLLRLVGPGDPPLAEALTKAWTQEAFGVVPPERRPPVQGTFPAEGPPGFWTEYMDGNERQPPEVAEARLKHKYYEWVSQRWKGPALIGSVIGARVQAVLTCLNPGAPEVGTLSLAMAMLPYWPQGTKVGEKTQTFYWYLQAAQARDFGPPAAPLMQVRLARQALAANPQDPACYFSLADGYRTLGAQEEHWNRQHDAPSLELRKSVRQMQIAAGLNGAMRVRPNVAGNYLDMAGYARQHGYWDLAYLYLMRAEQLLQGDRNIDPMAVQQVLQERDQVGEELKRRDQDYQRNASGAQGLEKYRWAIRTDRQHEYRMTTEDNKPYVDPRGRGLVVRAMQSLLEALNEGNRNALSPPEKAEASGELIRLLLVTGQVTEAIQWLGVLRPDMDKRSPALAMTFDLYLDGVIGNYQRLGEILKVNERMLETSANSMLAMGLSLAMTASTANVNGVLVQMQRQHHDFYVGQQLGLKTFRALNLLEMGDTQKARELLREVMDRAGPIEFPDRPIAQRYLEYLDKAAH